MKWIKTPIQTIADAGLLKEPSCLQAYMYLLSHVVCYADEGLKPGQVSYTLAQIASETGLTVKSVRIALSKLESKGLLQQYATRKRGTIGTLPHIASLYKSPAARQTHRTQPAARPDIILDDTAIEPPVIADFLTNV